MLLLRKRVFRLQECHSHNTDMLPAGAAHFCDTRFSDMLYCSAEDGSALHQSRVRSHLRYLQVSIPRTSIASRAGTVFIHCDLVLCSCSILQNGDSGAWNLETV